MNNSNDVWSPTVLVGEILYEPRCLHSGVLAAPPTTKLRPCRFGMVEL
jgi:hypothetical protein